MIKDFWATVYRRNVDDSSLRNDTIDVFLKDCFLNRNNSVCSGNFILTTLSIVTIVLCFKRLVGFYNSDRNYLYYAFIIYITAVLEVLLLAIKWAAFVWLYQMEFLASIMKMFQFVTLCHLKWSLVLDHCKVQRFLRPLLGLFVCFCTLIALLAMILNFSPWVQCLIPHWLIISVSEFVCIQSYVLAGIYVTQQINSMENENIKRKQKRHLWSVIISYEVSCCLTLTYYLTLQILGDEKIGCSGVFYHIPEVFAAFYVPAMIFRYLLPIIVTIFVMKPSSGYLNVETSFGRNHESLRPLINHVEEPSTSNEDDDSCQKLFSNLFWDSCAADPGDPAAYATADKPPSEVVVGQPSIDFRHNQEINKTLTINECSGEQISCSI